MQGADLKKQFGKRLKFVRELENLTQVGLAAAAGVTEQYLSMIERGLSSPSFDVVGRLCDCLNIEPADLFLFHPVSAEKGVAPSPRPWGDCLARFGLLTVDLPEGRGTWSQALRDLLGLPRTAPDPGLAGLEEAVHPEDRPAFHRAWELLLSGGGAPCFECRLIRGDGAVRHVLVQGECVFDASGVSERVHLSLVDITERKRMEQGVLASQAALERRVCERTTTLSQAVRRLEAEVAVRREAERALDRSSRSLRALLDATDDGAALYDEHMVVLAANAASARDWGVSPDQVEGLTLEQRLPSGEGTAIAIRQFGLARGSGRTQRFRYRLGDRSLDVTIHPIPPAADEQGLGPAFAVYARDVTEVCRSEVLLREREAAFMALFQAAPVGIGLVGPDRVIRMVNDRLCGMTGRPREALEGRSTRLLYPSDEEFERVGRMKWFDGASACREPLESAYVTADGHTLDILLNCAWLSSEDPSRGLIFTAQDISARRRAELALRESEERFRTVAEFSRDWDYWVGPGGGLRYVSPACETITGYSAEEFRSDPELLLRVVHPDDRERVARHLSEDALRGEPCSLEFRIVTRSGEERWIQHECLSVLGPGGEPMGRRVSNRDTTQRKTLEGMRDDVERVIRHDLRAPATSVIGVCRALREDGLNPDQNELVGLLEGSAQRMLDLLDLTLDIFRMETGAYPLRIEPVDLAGVVRRVFRETQAAVQPGPLGYRLEGEGAARSLAGAEAPFIVWGEPRLLHSLLANLVLNAAQASPSGEEVAVRLDRDGDADRICVRNRGVVPREVRERFFEKYATYGKRTGTGLGTYSARLVTELHGGRIRMRTSETDGTRVEVSLPHSRTKGC